MSTTIIFFNNKIEPARKTLKKYNGKNKQ